jgi:hypothetical protein
MTEPTNADLFALIENQNDAFKAHAQNDSDVADSQAKINEKQNETNIKILASLERIEQKVEPIVDFWDGSIVMKRVFSGVGGAVLGIIAIGSAIMWIINHLRP